MTTSERSRRNDHMFVVLTFAMLMAGAFLIVRLPHILPPTPCTFTGTIKIPESEDPYHICIYREGNSWSWQAHKKRPNGRWVQVGGSDGSYKVPIDTITITGLQNARK